MKKLFAVLLATTMMASMTACVNTQADDVIEDLTTDSTQDDADVDFDVDADADLDVDTDTDADTDADAMTWDVDSIEDYLQTILQTTEYIDDEAKDFFQNQTGTMEISAENEEYHLGSTEYSYERAVVCEPMMSSQAFALVMAVCATEEEAQAMAEGLKETVMPNKWICVEVASDDVVAVSSGTLVFLVMADNSENYLTAFDAMVNEG